MSVNNVTEKLKMARRSNHIQILSVALGVCVLLYLYIFSTIRTVNVSVYYKQNQPPYLGVNYHKKHLAYDFEEYGETNNLDANISVKIANFHFSTLKSPETYLYEGKGQTQRPDDQVQLVNNAIVKKSPVINILAWTVHHGAPEHQGMSPFHKCPIFRNCNITNDKSLIDETEYLLFHVSNINSKVLPPYQKPHQKWIMHTKEPPTRWYFKKVLLVEDRINFTMSYWSGSDVYVPYGWVVYNETKHLDPQHQITRSIVETKTGLVAWLVSHCETPSEREDYVAELAKYIQVDIYGRCGKPCPKEGDCLKMIGDTYKFYLAFENADCEDYITEKVWRNAFQYKMVPLVRGIQTTFSKHLPPKSFIQVDDFSSVQALADYLEFLSTNSDEYLKYLEWTMHYDIRTYNKGNFFCNICRVCNYYEGRSHITNLEYWTKVDSHCTLTEGYYKSLKEQNRTAHESISFSRV